MENINNMIAYLEDNQNKIDNEIKNDKKMKKVIWAIKKWSFLPEIKLNNLIF